MSGGRLFHALGPACVKARSPNDVVVREMMRSPTAADRKRRLGSERATGLQSSGSQPWRDLYVSKHNLNVTRCGTRSQCSESLMWLVMWSYFLRPHTILAAAFITD